METNLRPYHIFLIEDNNTEAMLLKLAFGNLENVKITSFSSGKQLLDNLFEKPDIVVMDYLLPDINGLELIKKIKEADKQIRIIVVSAQTDIHVIEKAQQLGISNYVVKSSSCIRYLHTLLEEQLLLCKYSNSYSKSQLFPNI
jgi:DNA-binding NarL/FixJ family response regulator